MTIWLHGCWAGSCLALSCDEQLSGGFSIAPSLPVHSNDTLKPFDQVYTAVTKSLRTSFLHLPACVKISALLMGVTLNNVIPVCLQSSITNEWREQLQVYHQWLGLTLCPFSEPLCEELEGRDTVGCRCPRPYLSEQTKEACIDLMPAKSRLVGMWLYMDAFSKDFFLSGNNMLFITLKYFSTQSSLRILLIKQEGTDLSRILVQHCTQHENVLYVILIKVFSQFLCEHTSWKVVYSIIKEQF